MSCIISTSSVMIGYDKWSRRYTNWAQQKVAKFLKWQSCEVPFSVPGYWLESNQMELTDWKEKKSKSSFTIWNKTTLQSDNTDNTWPTGKITSVISCAQKNNQKAFIWFPFMTILTVWPLHEICFSLVVVFLMGFKLYWIYININVTCTHSKYCNSYPYNTN